MMAYSHVCIYVCTYVTYMYVYYYRYVCHVRTYSSAAKQKTDNATEKMHNGDHDLIMCDGGPSLKEQVRPNLY